MIPSLSILPPLNVVGVRSLWQRARGIGCAEVFSARWSPGSNLLAFAIASAILIAIPGPSVLFVISRGVALGRRAALATVAGNCAGVYCQVILVALGVGVLVERSAVIYNTIKLAGAVYLVWLGVRTFQKRRSLAEALGKPPAPKSGRRILRDGFVVGLTNPKAAVFFAAILPQFVDTSLGHVPLQMLMLGLVFVVIAMVIDGLWGARSRNGARAARGLAPPARRDRRRQRRRPGRPRRRPRRHRPQAVRHELRRGRRGRSRCGRRGPSRSRARRRPVCAGPRSGRSRGRTRGRGARS